MKILALQNCDIEGFGLFEQHLLARGAYYALVHTHRDEPIPTDDDFDVILVGPTPIPATKAHEHPFLIREQAYLTQALDRGTPCLGICGGGQLLAQQLGAEVTRSFQKEIGGYEVQVTTAGQADPLLAGFPERFPVFHWHSDTFAIPEGAERLGESDRCKNQIFRRGTAVGVQFHIEITSDTAAVWADAYADELAAFRKTKDDVVGECRNREKAMQPLAARMMDNFLRLID